MIFVWTCARSFSFLLVAGHDDAAAKGGNSTTPTGAVLTTQQAIDLKKAVQTAIGNAMELLASTQVDAGAGGQDSVCFCHFHHLFAR